MYDYIIVGSGPSGLALATLLCKKYKILLIDRENDIGGCHRVRRVNGFFTEHGPRIYIGNYNSLNYVLNEMNIKFHDVFTKYDASFNQLIKNSTNIFTLKEIYILTMGYFEFMAPGNEFNKITLEEFMGDQFSDNAIDYISKICKMTDGGDIDRYTVYEFYQIMNQNALYNIYLPKIPNDIGLFRSWKEYLEQNGVDIMLNTGVRKMTYNDKKVEHLILENNTTISGRNIILAIPPVDALQLFDNSNIVTDDNYRKWVYDTNYLTYITITYHWSDKTIKDKTFNEFPNNEWGVMFNIASNYTKFNESSSVLIATFTVFDVKSSNINKTANECGEDELIKEVARQIGYDDYDHAFISPGDYKMNNKWITKDTAFFNTKYGHMPFETKFNNLFTVGTHNGNSEYAFTSMESAIDNSIAFYEKYNSVKINKIRIWTLNDLMYICMVILAIVIMILISFYK